MSGRKKPSTKPKRPSSAYMFFSKVVSPRLRSERTDSSHKQILEEVGRLWRELSDSERQKYIDLAEDDKLRYKREMTAWIPNRPEENRARKHFLNREDGKPKRPASAYMFFSKEVSPIVRKENPDWDQKTVLLEVGRQWSDLTDEQREKYQEEAELDKNRYENEMKSWHPPPSSQSSSAPKRPKSAYILFSTNYITCLREKDPDRKQTDLIRMAASRWKRMSESERAPFEMEAVRDKTRYEQEMVEWVPVPLAEPIAQSPVSSNRHNLDDGNRTSSFNSRSGQSLSSDPPRGHFTSSSSGHARSKDVDRFLSVTPDKAKRVKKNSSAYMFFSKDMSVQLRKENPGLSQQAIMSKVGELWRKLDSSLREVYSKKAEEDKQRYERQMRSLAETETRGSRVVSEERVNDSQNLYSQHPFPGSFLFENPLGSYDLGREMYNPHAQLSSSYFLSGSNPNALYSTLHPQNSTLLTHPIPEFVPADSGLDDPSNENENGALAASAAAAAAATAAMFRHGNPLDFSMANLFGADQFVHPRTLMSLPMLSASGNPVSSGDIHSQPYYTQLDPMQFAVNASSGFSHLPYGSLPPRSSEDERRLEESYALHQSHGNPNIPFPLQMSMAMPVPMSLQGANGNSASAFRFPQYMTDMYGTSEHEDFQAFQGQDAGYSSMQFIQVPPHMINPNDYFYSDFSALQGDLSHLASHSHLPFDMNSNIHGEIPSDEP